MSIRVRNGRLLFAVSTAAFAPDRGESVGDLTVAQLIETAARSTR
jgi:hypothetical protein